MLFNKSRKKVADEHEHDEEAEEAEGSSNTFKKALNAALLNICASSMI